MTGCLSITSLNKFHVLKVVLSFSHCKYLTHHCIQSYKNQKYKKKEKKEKRADCEKKKGIAPYQKEKQI